ncbi:CG1628 [Drosophila busckii]|uniref:CG1628 n=1 Tax=Drosophila busckii TaxID=30019 RepID=A0A0M4EVR3_DROBS|nr:CG1628 [Drosophila busckii]
MSPTPAELVAQQRAQSNGDSENDSNSSKGRETLKSRILTTVYAVAAATTIGRGGGQRGGSAVAAAAAAAATASVAPAALPVEVSKSENVESKRPPNVGSSKVGSEVLIMTPEQIAEAYERALEEEERQREAEESSKKTLLNRLLSILSAAKACRDGLLYFVGRILRFILQLDMHGGGTGNNINFVEGLIDFLAGSIGGAAQVYVSQPLDTVKVKMQTFPETYKGMFDCFMKTYRKDGVMRGLYAGSVPAVFANVAENSVLFAAYGGCQKFVSYAVGKENPLELTVVENACAGSLAACFSTLTLCPTELIKCKLQALREMKHFVEPSQSADLRTPWTLTRYIWRTEGEYQS